MKIYLFILAVLSCFLYSCHDETKGFDIMTEKTILFRPNQYRYLSQLTKEQRKELKHIIDKHDLFYEGTKQEDFPFCGYLAVFDIMIDDKPYRLWMFNNSRHLSFGEQGEEFSAPLFALSFVNEGRQDHFHSVSPDIRLFESPELYKELEQFVYRVSKPIVSKE